MTTTTQQLAEMIYNRSAERAQRDRRRAVRADELFWRRGSGSNYAAPRHEETFSGWSITAMATAEAMASLA